MADGANEFGKKSYFLSHITYLINVRAALCNTERQPVRKAKGSLKQTKICKDFKKV